MYYVETYPIELVSNENKPLLSCSLSVDLVSIIDLVTLLMGALELILPPIDPSEFSFQDVVLPSNEYLLEARINLDIPLDDVSIVLSHDHIFEHDYPTTEPNPNWPLDLDLNIDRSLDIDLDESINSTIELEVGVPYEFDVLYRYSNSPNDKFLPIDSIYRLYH